MSLSSPLKFLLTFRALKDFSYQIPYLYEVQLKLMYDYSQKMTNETKKEVDIAEFKSLVESYHKILGLDIGKELELRFLHRI